MFQQKKRLFMKTPRLVLLISFALGFVQSVHAENLVELYDIAVQQDPQFQAARATQSSVKKTEDIAKATLLPAIGLAANLNRVNLDVRSSSTATDDDYNKQDLTLSLSQPVYRKDRWLSVDQARILSAKADVDFLVAEQDLIVRLARAYFDVLSAQDTLDLVLSDRKAIERQLEQAKQRFDVGLIAITAVYEAQAAYDQSTANQINSENALDNANEVLREIVGNQEFLLNKLVEELELAKPDPADLATWTEKALQQNPNVMAAKNNSEVAQKEIEVKRSGHYPTVDLVGSHAISRTSANNGSDLDTTSIGLQLALPLYSGGGVIASTEQAQLDFEAAQYALEQQKRAVTRQVRDAYRGVIASISQVKALEATRKSSKSALEATEAGFEVGTRTIVDVLNSQRNLYSTINDYAQARYDYIINGLLLKQAAGTLSVKDLERVNQWLK
jgi:outer membrane protein